MSKRNRQDDVPNRDDSDAVEVQQQEHRKLPEIRQKPPTIRRTRGARRPQARIMGRRP